MALVLFAFLLAAVGAPFLGMNAYPAVVLSAVLFFVVLGTALSCRRRYKKLSTGAFLAAVPLSLWMFSEYTSAWAETPHVERGVLMLLVPYFALAVILSLFMAMDGESR